MQRRGFLTGLAAASVFARQGYAADEAEGPPWSYNPDANDGPEHWGALDQKYRLCGDGRKQSPIELVYGSFQLPRKEMQLNWNKLGGKVVDERSHHTIKIDVRASGLTTRLDGIEYKMDEYHVHVPSEHTFRGEHKPMEVHAIHTKPGTIGTTKLVVGVMVEVADASNNRLFDQILNARRDPEGVPVAILDNGSLIPPVTRPPFGFFRYAGSLTTPACDEIVDWVVLDTPATARISPKNLDTLKSRYGPPQHMPAAQTILARPIQPVNGRVVRWYRL